MILKLYVIAYFLGAVLAQQTNSKKLSDFNTRHSTDNQTETFPIDSENGRHPDLEHSIGMVRSEEELLAEGKGKNISSTFLG